MIRTAKLEDAEQLVEIYAPYVTDTAITFELEKELQQMGILNMCACISAPRGNDPYLDENSIQFHGHLGYRMVGRFIECGYKFNRWYDMVWMEKHIGEHTENIAPPRFKQ